MIRFSLSCDQGHAFESWFPSGASFDRQCEAGLVACPHCGSAGVSKALMAPAVSTGRREASPPPKPAGTPEPQPLTLLSDREKALRTMLREIREHVTRSSDYVGPRFAEEARRIHEGDVPHRSIYGEASPAETRALLEDGIEVHPLPPAPDDRN